MQNTFYDKSGTLYTLNPDGTYTSPNGTIVVAGYDGEVTPLDGGNVTIGFNQQKLSSLYLWGGIAGIAIAFALIMFWVSGSGTKSN